MFNFLTATTTGAAGSMAPTIIMILGMVAVFYFFLYRPQKKQEKETQEMRNSIEIGDVISTVGGIIGIKNSVTFSLLKFRICQRQGEEVVVRELRTTFFPR